MRAKLTMCCLKTLVVVAVLASFSAGALYAQTFGEITGRVTHPSGAVGPSASLTLTNVDTHAVRSGVTAEAGTYSFPSGPPGPYRLRTEIAGFETWVSEPFEVQVQQVVRVDIALQVGQANESIEVAAN